ncbi:Tyrosine-protein phosphatase non-receptor type 2 [Oopsacas minuta]|uniref:protein-tyrosine-phosphatase n=1 Tax=Oopsacas minuta TaxID=111878 RepID=A0AAV7K8S6_9METZ|nr:Tyrosine-protein phosphatase non-receptor type 2 [Oopsacas minuta]
MSKEQKSIVLYSNDNIEESSHTNDCITNTDAIIQNTFEKHKPNHMDIKLTVPIEKPIPNYSKDSLPICDKSASRLEDEYIEKERSQGLGWSLLYSRLNDISNESRPSCSISQQPDNEHLNRYSNILPNDNTRVVLNGLANTDYINANYVKIDKANTRYIMTQAPLSETCEHFWSMVWQVESCGIVMLNKLVERGMQKCYSYYPTSPGQFVKFGKIRVTCESREEEKNYYISTFKLECVSESKPRFLTHFQYTVWPDFGAPVSLNSFLTFLSVVRATGILHNSQSPAVIHCSAGVGRSGAFILIDSCLLIAERANSCDSITIQDTLLEMRSQRFGCIQSKEQLRFSYACVIHGLKRLLKDGDGIKTYLTLKRSHEDSAVGNKEDVKKKKRNE